MAAFTPADAALHYSQMQMIDNYRAKNRMAWTGNKPATKPDNATPEERLARIAETMQEIQTDPGAAEIKAGYIACEIVRKDDKAFGREKTSVSVGQCRNIVRSFLGGYERFAGDEARRCKKMPGTLFVSLEDYLNAQYNDKFNTRVVIPDAAWGPLVAEERTRREERE